MPSYGSNLLSKSASNVANDNIADLTAKTNYNNKSSNLIDDIRMGRTTLSQRLGRDVAPSGFQGGNPNWADINIPSAETPSMPFSNINSASVPEYNNGDDIVRAPIQDAPLDEEAPQPLSNEVNTDNVNTDKKSSSNNSKNFYLSKFKVAVDGIDDIELRSVRNLRGLSFSRSYINNNEGGYNDSTQHFYMNESVPMIEFTIRMEDNFEFMAWVENGADDKRSMSVSLCTNTGTEAIRFNFFNSFIAESTVNDVDARHFIYPTMNVLIKSERCEPDEKIELDDVDVEMKSGAEYMDNENDDEENAFQEKYDDENEDEEDEDEEEGEEEDEDEGEEDEEEDEDEEETEDEEEDKKEEEGGVLNSLKDKLKPLAISGGSLLATFGMQKLGIVPDHGAWKVVLPIATTLIGGTLGASLTSDPNAENADEEGEEDDDGEDEYDEDEEE